MDADYQTITRNIHKASRIIYLGLENPRKLRENREFRELFQDYESNPDIRSYVEAIAEGLNLQVLLIDNVSIQLLPKSNAIFSMKSDDLPNFRTADSRKYFGLILLGISAYYYPQLQNFEQHSTALGLDDKTLDVFIRDRAQSLRNQLPVNEQDAPAGDDAGLEKLLIGFLALKSDDTNINTRSTSLAFINNCFRYLVDQRLLIEDADRYYPTQKFKIKII